MSAWDLAERNAEPALKFNLERRASSLTSRGRRPELLILVQVAENVVSTLPHLQLPSRIDVGLQVSSDWLESPTVRGGRRPYRVLDASPLPVAEADLLASSMRVVNSLPWPEDLRRRGFEIDGDDAFALEDRLAEIDEAESTESPNHQAFGFAQLLQGDVWESLREDLSSIGDTAALSQLDGVEHRLLLQVDSDDRNGLRIADRGRVYVLVPADDLREAVFDRALVCVQSS